ncbi:uncharacterized protein PITG_11185 [Phytophthora infestans T30-4]|uniref:Secreted RxLR effector peptide protein n=1 Tax=Phytophthora infestans (strain T30-4) TaxID=403677 RepID=D0NGD7_PHYIT|nr:uncharacterized protein PITG_11185 [Phytophthora infestans T30-4]EEY57338.1 hypothetical protein PITG_11185 [Phytophthora infestans T30-4]|eukprot:XP_002901948.1 hypothetical protein PITG_11185 [Phytophthora infestans T30-4]
MFFLLQLALLVLVGHSLIAVETANFTNLRPLTSRRHDQVEVSKRIALGDWSPANEDLTIIIDILPDFWEPRFEVLYGVDPRVPTNGAEPPEQLVKVTDRKHKFPVFATMCSLTFLATIVTLLIVCTS